MSDTVYTYTNTRGTTYYLNTKEIEGWDGKIRSIYYFSKDQRPTGCWIPADRVVAESPKTGLPMLKKVAV
jgi:hypothetical protein